MNYRFFTVLATAALAGAFTVGPVFAEDPQTEAPIDGRRIDLALGVGAQVHLSNKVPVDDNLLYGGSIAIELTDRIDGEFGTLVVDTHTVKEDGQDREHQTVNYVYGGFRLYPFFEIDARVRPYIFAGLTEYWGLEPGKNRTGYMVGPGIRFQSGDRFGFTLKSPLVFQFNGDAYGRMLPHIDFFWKFDFADGGFH